MECHHSQLLINNLWGILLRHTLSNGALPMPYATGSQGPMLPTPASHLHAQNSMITGASHAGAPGPIDIWGHQFGLDAEECGYLQKLGFRVGDDLGAISENMWEAAVVLVCHRVSILKAYSLSLTDSAAVPLQ